MKQLFLIALTALVLTSCSTDVEMNAPYKKTTVIYGLLSADENGDGVSNALDTQWIKINKTFLGEGDNRAYALVRDSLEYHEADFAKKVVQQLHDGQVVQEFPLHSVEVSNKQINGVFYAPLQTVYYFTPPASGLNQGDKYKILVQFTDGREVAATTDIVNFSQFMWQSPQVGSTINLARSNSNTMSVIFNDNVMVKWNPALNAEIYQGTLRFNFTEYTYADASWTGAPVSTEQKYLDFNIGTTTKTKMSPSGYLELYFNGESFYTFLSGQLEKKSNVRRVIGTFTDKTRCFDIRLDVGNEILADYLSVNTPSTGIVQEKPTYTNVENGLGLFAGRGTRILKDLALISSNNNGVLLTGNLDAFFLPQLVDYNFCDPNPSSTYYCNF
jgi:hypothetical protein